MKQTTLHLFGIPRIVHNDNPIALPRRKSMALLAYLAASGPSGRHSLATLLWPEASSHRALANLRNALHGFNETPLKHIVCADRDKIWLQSGDMLNIDLHSFHQLTASSELSEVTRAIDLYTGPFLEGFAIRDSQQFEQWHMQEARFLQQSCIGALNRLYDHYESRYQWDLAIACAMRICEMDNLDETAWRRLLRILALAGRKSEVDKQYHQLIMILDHELQVPPEEETTLLMEQIQSGQLQPVSSSISSETVQLTQLPYAQTPFVGRRDDVNRLMDLLLEPHHRIVTLTGPGGSGKSRLALQAASQISRRFRHGVIWVSFESIDSPEMIGLKLAEALNLHATRLDPYPEWGKYPDIYALKTQLILYLQKREILLILDNFEHLANDCRLLTEILETVAGVQFMITSRIRTNLRSEWVFETRGMEPPGTCDPAVIAQSDAVRLFCQSARQIVPEFRLSAGNRVDIVDICRCLQGNPLALEIAATWTKVYDCSTISREIQDNLDFLVSSTQDLPEKHQSMRTVFQQTWDMLSRTTRNILLNLSVFQGGFSREAARIISGSSISDLGELIDFSVVRRIGPDRFEIHELLRQFAWKTACQIPENERQLRDSHKKYFMEQLNRLGNSLTHGNQGKAFARMNLDSSNFRAAWFRAAETGDCHELRRAAMTMFLFYDQKYYFQEGFDLFGNAVRILDSTPEQKNQDADIFRGFAIGLQGWFMRYSQEAARDAGIEMVAEAGSLMRQGIAFLEPFSDQREWALINVLDVFFSNRWKCEDSWTLLEKCRHVFQAHEDLWGEAFTVQCMGCWHWAVNPEEALACQQEALKIRQKADDAWGEAQSHNAVASVLMRLKQYEKARDHLHKSLNIDKKLKENPNGMIGTLFKLAVVYDVMDRKEEALEWLKQALDISESMNNLYRTALILGNIGVQYMELKDNSKATEYLERCLSLCKDAGFEKRYAVFEKYLEAITV